MPEIRPTHTCFDDALEAIVEIVKQDPSVVRTKEFMLVHAICRAPNGELFAHAWIEREETTVIHKAILDGCEGYFRTERGEYYEAYGVLEVTRYTVKEAGEENARTMTFGPWKPEYLALCGRGNKILGRREPKCLSQS